MTKPLVNQPSSWPTRKLAAAAAVGPAVTEAWGEIMVSLYPPLSGPSVAFLAGSLAALAVGYFVRDRANT